nr:hypothetical protein Q903MT_gene4670 [Picea sitchensis]
MAQTKKDGMRSPAIHFGAPHPDFHPNSDDLSLFPSPFGRATTYLKELREGENLLFLPLSADRVGGRTSGEHRTGPHETEYFIFALLTILSTHLFRSFFRTLSSDSSLSSLSIHSNHIPLPT